MKGQKTELQTLSHRKIGQLYGSCERYFSIPPDYTLLQSSMALFQGVGPLLTHLSRVGHRGQSADTTVPEVAAAVQDVTEALRRLDDSQPGETDINRSLVLPITLAGCHCETPSQQAFFRSRFQVLGGDSAAFGNSRQALQLMEEVWRKRAVVDAGTKVCWRAMMKNLGWDCGILLI